MELRVAKVLPLERMERVEVAQAVPRDVHDPCPEGVKPIVKRLWVCWLWEERIWRAEFLRGVLSSVQLRRCRQGLRCRSRSRQQEERGRFSCRRVLALVFALAVVGAHDLEPVRAGGVLLECVGARLLVVWRFSAAELREGELPCGFRASTSLQFVHWMCLLYVLPALLCVGSCVALPSGPALACAHWSQK